MVCKWTARKKAQKHIPALVCQECGATENLERHHHDYSKALDVQVLCPPCHVKADQRDGTRRSMREYRCRHCNTVFLPNQHHAKACSPECVRALIIAATTKRWGPPRLTAETTALIKRMVADKMSQRTIANQLGISRGLVQHALRTSRRVVKPSATPSSSRARKSSVGR